MTVQPPVSLVQQQQLGSPAATAATTGGGQERKKKQFFRFFFYLMNTVFAAINIASWNRVSSPSNHHLLQRLQSPQDHRQEWKVVVFPGPHDDTSNFANSDINNNIRADGGGGETKEKEEDGSPHFASSSSSDSNNPSTTATTSATSSSEATKTNAIATATATKRIFTTRRPMSSSTTTRKLEEETSSSSGTNNKVTTPSSSEATPDSKEDDDDIKQEDNININEDIIIPSKPVVCYNSTYCCGTWDNDDADLWWQHHPHWEIVHENDDGFCFSPIQNQDDKREFLQRVHYNQWKIDIDDMDIMHHHHHSKNDTALTTLASNGIFPQDYQYQVNCSDLAPTVPISMGYGASINWLMKPFWYAIQNNKPFQIQRKGPWIYAAKEQQQQVQAAASNDDDDHDHHENHHDHSSSSSSWAYCEDRDISCFYLPISPCDRTFTDQPRKRSNYNKKDDTQFQQNMWLQQYMTRPKQRMRYEQYKLRQQNKNLFQQLEQQQQQQEGERKGSGGGGGCIALHVRRTDASIPVPPFRRYAAVQEYLDLLPHPSLTTTESSDSSGTPQQQTIFLLTDDQTTIEEVQQNHMIDKYYASKYKWVYLDKKRNWGAEHGVYGHIPGGSNGPEELLYINLEMEMVRHCHTFVQGRSAYGDLLWNQMRLSGRSDEDNYYLRTTVSKEEVQKYSGKGEREEALIKQIEDFYGKPESLQRKSRNNNNNNEHNKEKSLLRRKKEEKPLLLLHVGPKKTASTTIQETMLGKEWFRNKLEMDNYHTEPLDYHRINDLAEALHQNRNGNETANDAVIRSLWEDRMTKPYQASLENGMNIIHSCEAFAEIPADHPLTEELFRSLETNWRIMVVIVYRRLHDWLPSKYAEEHKRKLWNRKMNRPRRERNFDAVDTFPETFKEFKADPTDPLGTYEKYSKIFGKDKVVTLDLLDPEGIRTAFACRGIPGATRACQAARTVMRKNKVRNRSEGLYLFEHDILAGEALRRRMMRKGVFYNLGGRHEVNLLIKDFIDNHLNIEVQDLPKTCLEKEDRNWLWNRTLVSEQTLSNQPLDEKELLERFRNARYNRLWCSIDAKRVLRDKEWKDFFRSLTLKARQKIEERKALSSTS